MPVAKHGVVVTQEQDAELDLVKPHSPGLSPSLQPVRILLQSLPPSSRWISHPAQCHPQTHCRSLILSYALSSHCTQQWDKTPPAKAWNRARMNTETSTGHRLKSNLQELGAHGWCLLHHQIHGLEGIFHLPDTIAKKFMSAFSVSRWHFPFPVFARLILSICLSKVLFYQNHQKSLHTVIDLCCAAVFVTFMHWCDFFFSGSITLRRFFATKLSVNPSQVTHVWPAIHQQE